MQCLVVLGDLVDSKQIPDRAAFQKRLAATLRELSLRHRSLRSPYTLTLGDEFQAVYGQPRRLFADLCRLRLACLPHRVRLVISLGEITTAINPKQAIGMDGPAFHHARTAIEALKKSGGDLALIGDAPPDPVARNAWVDLLSAHFETWKPNRWLILHGLLTGRTIPELAATADISEPAVYKNIRHGRLDSLATLLGKIETDLARRLTG